MPDEDGETVDTPGDDLRDVLGMPPRRAPAVLTAGQIIDEAYRIEEELGAGGMGRVYRAHDLRLSRDVALKLHVSALAPDDDTLQREATALARLAHPNVVTVYEVGVWSGHPWVAMEYVPGGTVRTWLRDEPRTPRAILALFIAAGRGLAAAHAAGLVHRDFKPDNVLVGADGRARVADFGLARDVNSDARVGDVVGSPAPPQSVQTRTGAVRGTPAYMAPEQRDGTRIDASVDQYAFAVSLWEALAGARPFVDELQERVAPPPAGRIPRHVEVALRRAFAPVSSERWPSMAALLDELARDPARTRLIVVSSIVVVLALVGGGYAIASRTHASAPAIACGSVDELATTWSGAQRDAVRAQYAGDAGTRVVGFLDAWSDRWRRERTAVCEAGATQPTSLLALRDACLDRARASLAATVDVLATKLTPVQALTTASSIARIEDCADTTALAGGEATPTEPGAIASAHAAEALVAQVHASINAGQYPRALVLARDAVAYTDALHRPALSARTQLAFGSALYMTGTTDGILERYEAAARLAAEAHDDAFVAECYIGALHVVSRLEKAGEVDRLVSVADTAIARAGNPAILVERLVAKRADIARMRDKLDDALPLYQQTVAAFEARYGESSELARHLTSLAQVLTAMNRFAEARTALERAAGIMETQYGTLHPNLAVILTSLGDVDYNAGAYATAIATYRRALALKEATLGPQHRSFLPTLVNLAISLDENAEYTEAVAVGARALAIAEHAMPPAHPKLALLLSTLGTAQMHANDWAAATTSIERAIAILAPIGDDPAQIDPLRALARLRTHARALPAARAAAERAVAIATKLDPDAIATAQALADLARVQRASKDPAAAATFAKAIAMLRAEAGDKHPLVASLVAESGAP